MHDDDGEAGRVLIRVPDRVERCLCCLLRVCQLHSTAYLWVCICLVTFEWAAQACSTLCVKPPRSCGGAADRLSLGRRLRTAPTKPRNRDVFVLGRVAGRAPGQPCKQQMHPIPGSFLAQARSLPARLRLLVRRSWVRLSHSHERIRATIPQQLVCTR